MLADLFALANRMTTLLCLAALVLAVAIQYWLRLSAGNVWLRRLPMLLALLLLIACAIGSLLARRKQQKDRKETPHIG